MKTTQWFALMAGVLVFSFSFVAGANNEVDGPFKGGDSSCKEALQTQDTDPLVRALGYQITPEGQINFLLKLWDRQYGHRELEEGERNTFETFLTDFSRRNHLHIHFDGEAYTLAIRKIREEQRRGLEISVFTQFNELGKVDLTGSPPGYSGAMGRPKKLFSFALIENAAHGERTDFLVVNDDRKEPRLFVLSHLKVAGSYNFYLSLIENHGSTPKAVITMANLGEKNNTSSYVDVGDYELVISPWYARNDFCETQEMVVYMPEGRRVTLLACVKEHLSFPRQAQAIFANTVNVENAKKAALTISEGFNSATHRSREIWDRLVRRAVDLASRKR